MSYLPAPPPRFVYRLGGWIHSLVVRLAQRLTPAPIALYEQLTGVWMTQMLYAMTRLELVEALAAAPRSDEELAALAGVERDTLARLLRALVAVGLLARGRDRRYRLTRLSEPLRKDAPDSMRDITLYGGSLHSMHAWSRFADVVRTGRDGYELAHGRSLFDYLAANPDEAATFAGAMVCVTRLETPALVRGYEWGAHTRVCDVGGGRGFLLGAVLAAHPRLDGILFDEADVVAGAREVLDSFGAGSRATIAAGSFFDAVPSGCDLYVLKEILHDWDDERAARILATVRRAMAPGARLAVIEMVLVDDERMHPAKLVDLQMMTATHRGRQRTREEFATLFAANGLRLLRVVELATLSSIVEAIAV